MPWNLTGNAGTNPTRNYLGTTDFQPLIIRTNGKDAMRINPNGNIGIAHGSPAGKLHIGDTNPDIFLVGNTTANQDGLRLNYNETPGVKMGVIDVKGSSFRIRGESGNTGGGATERLFIDLTSGNIGIANTDPTGSLQIGGSGPDIFLVGNTTANQAGLRIHYNADAGLRTGVIDVKGSSFRIRGELANTGGGATERLFIDLTNGNVGIANDLPAGKLHIGGSGPDILLAGNTAADQDGLRLHYDENPWARMGVIDIKGSSFRIRGESEGIGAGATERLRINLENGNIGIANTDPTGKLHIGGSQPDIFLVGNTTANQAGLRIHYNADAGLNEGVIDVKGSSFRIRGEVTGNAGDGATERLRINLGNGNVGIANTNPTGKLHIGGSQPDIFLVGNTTRGELGLRIHYNADAGLRTGVIDVKGLSLCIRGESGPGDGATERLFINLTNGNVGIGTVNPGSRLDVRVPPDSGYATYGSVDPGTTFGGLGWHSVAPDLWGFTRVGVRGVSTDGCGVEGYSANGVGVYGSSSNNLAAYFVGPVLIENDNAGLPALRVSGIGGNQNVEFGGSLLVGTELPTQTAGPARIRIAADAANNDIEIGSANPMIRNITFWNTGTATTMNINAASLNGTSDVRLKRNIMPLTDVMEKLEQIRGVSFEWKNGPQSPSQSAKIREIGVIAQEVEASFPEIVSSWGTEGYKAVDYGSLTAILIEAVKQLKSENNLLLSRLEVLEEKVIREKRSNKIF